MLQSGAWTPFPPLYAESQVLLSCFLQVQSTGEQS